MSAVKRIMDSVAKGKPAKGKIGYAIDKVRDLAKYDKETRKVVRRYNDLPGNTAELTDQLLKSKIFKNKEEAGKAVRELYAGDGTGSFFGDIFVNRIIPKKNNMRGRVKDAIAGYQRKIYDIDMRAGKRLAEISGAPERLKILMDSERATDPKAMRKAMEEYAKAADASRKSIFVEKRHLSPNIDDITDLKERLNRGPDKAAIAYIPRASAPIGKSMKVVLPIVGAGTIAMKTDEAVEKKRRAKEGSSDMNKRELAEKVASSLGDASLAKRVDKTDDVLIRKIASATLDAAGMMKRASAEIRASREFMEKIANENRMLKLQVMAMERSGRAVELATKMKNKGLLKRAEFDSKVDEIMDLNDEAFKLLKEAVDMSPDVFSEDSTLQESMDFIAQSGEAMSKKAEEEEQEEKMTFSKAVIEAASAIKPWSYLK